MKTKDFITYHSVYPITIERLNLIPNEANFTQDCGKAYAVAADLLHFFHCCLFTGISFWRESKMGGGI
jgi:hypothetical protein